MLYSRRLTKQDLAKQQAWAPTGAEGCGVLGRVVATGIDFEGDMDELSRK